MTAALRITDRELALLHQDVRTGHAFLCTFEGANGTAWLEVLGPRGARPAGEWLRAEVPTLRLWPGPGPGPVAVAVANDRFDRHLRGIADAARPLLPSDEALLLAEVLAVVQAAVKAGPRHLPTVGPRLSRSGTPDPSAWASALSLADLQAAFHRSLGVEGATRGLGE